MDIAMSIVCIGLLALWAVLTVLEMRHREKKDESKPGDEGYGQDV